MFPVGYGQPARLEFMGDTVESIRAFDPTSQRSLGAMDELLLLPLAEFGRGRLGPESARAIDDRAAELGLARRERRDLVEGVRGGLVLPGTEFLLPYFYADLGRMADYLPPDTMLWLQAPAELEAAAEAWWMQVEAHAADAARDGRFHPPPDRLYLSPAAWREGLGGRPRVEAETLDVLDDAALAVTSYSTDGLALRDPAAAGGPLAAVAAQLAGWQRQGARLVVVATGGRQRDRMREMLAGHDIDAGMSADPFPQALAAPGRRPLALVGGLTRGVWLPADALALVTEAEIFGERRQIRRGRRARPADFLSTLAELKPDDYVVHVDHGIGIYRGLRHMQVAGTEGDYLHLEYAGGDRLYLPVDRINLVQRYLSADGAAPPLDKLGGASWERVKAKTRESILAMAKELLGVYAAREAHGRPAYGAADGLYREFVARFPFEETPDQQRAIDDVLADLVRDKPMDRLVCGDVGFGKTEVAMRAAFLAVLEGKQVAVLVPTTVLAQQHLETFQARFAGYPVTVDVLSRFQSSAENRRTIERVGTGRLDVVIGTHRLLQKDVAFQRLGLLIVDEEHRFGVRHKERIRQMRA
ncbi:MAG: DEAD/DEAH box helicase, partial [Deltaproteobacteria bacterium]